MSDNAEHLTDTYECTERCDLQFIVASQGARLQLTIESPNGKKVQQEGDSTIAISIENAEIGNWNYTVTVRDDVPEVFLISLGIWQK